MAAPKFPGKGAKPGMYTLPSGEERYYSGGNDFYRSAPGNGAQVWGELTNGSGWRGMSQFDNYNDGRLKGGVESQSQNPFAANFQLFDFPDDAPIRAVIGPRKPNKVNDPVVDVAPKEETRTNPLNVVQKGTNLSPGGGPIKMTREDVNAMYTRQGLMSPSPAQAYSSNQLIGTNSNPFSATQPQTPGFSIENPDIGGYNGAAYDSKEGAEAAGSRDISQFAPMSGQEPQIMGQADGITSSRLSDALNDTAGMQSYMSKFSSGDQQRAADMAFLNGKDSMSGLRAKEKVNGVVYAGGQHHIESGDGYQSISRDNARSIANGDAKAQDFLKKKVTDLKKESPETPSEAQTPPASFQQGVNSGLKEGDYSGIDTSRGDFKVNNDMGNNGFDTSIDIGNKGGKKYGYKMFG